MSIIEAVWDPKQATDTEAGNSVEDGPQSPMTPEFLTPTESTFPNMDEANGEEPAK